MTEVDAEPGPLWPDDVVAGARRAAVSGLKGIRTGGENDDERPVLTAGLLTSVATVATRAALNAPEVTAYLLAQHKDGYNSGVEEARSGLRDYLDALEGERDRLAAALADAERRGDAERAFLSASVAVWREIDRLSDEPAGYAGLAESTALRQTERAAWERYRAALAGDAGEVPG